MGDTGVVLGTVDTSRHVVQSTSICDVSMSHPTSSRSFASPVESHISLMRFVLPRKPETPT